MSLPLSVIFAAGSSGRWRIDRIEEVIGETLGGADRLAVVEGASMIGEAWTLRGVTSNTRYAARDEVEALRARQEGLNRSQATCAALIPIRKSAAWWALAQDERRAIFEEQSHHTAIGLDYLPGVARRLHHSRELAEPFDFLTWFEYAPEHARDFERLVDRLRRTPEWAYVEREVDLRLSRDGL
ncbi:chlorite dismutase family protein [Methylopila turkensis]|uniref:Chlorite dismutase n=1 Tax=Methylopila turkensis TaxID=1437816 RepID=A0A9W6JNZ3_9HYPH|nr:chlorite dismutase family protein [Methylopila turkensis]GLK80602.1 hypothetical protein GCM10008174_23430 [Methylopila turkensis]